MSTAEKWALGLALALVALAGAAAFRGLRGGMTSPPPQPQALPELPAHLCHPHELAPHGGYVYTPHRYPRQTGLEITTVLHGGWSSMRVRDQRDVQWMISPPAEVEL